MNMLIFHWFYWYVREKVRENVKQPCVYHCFSAANSRTYHPDIRTTSAGHGNSRRRRRKKVSDPLAYGISSRTASHARHDHVHETRNRNRFPGWIHPQPPIYIYIHIYVDVYAHTCMHTYIHAHIHTHIHTCMHTIQYNTIHTYM